MVVNTDCEGLGHPYSAYCNLLIKVPIEKRWTKHWIGSWDEQEPRGLFTILPNCPLKDGALTIELKSNNKNENKSD